jgi:hypothetical protein
LDNKLKKNWFLQEEMEGEPKKLWEDKSLVDIMI